MKAEDGPAWGMDLEDRVERTEQHKNVLKWRLTIWHISKAGLLMHGIQYL